MNPTTKTAATPRSFVDSIEPGASERGPITVLVVESGSGGDKRPVLLFLHGKGEASIWPNHLSRLCDHLSPPFQALLGCPREVTVVAPLTVCEDRCLLR
jgi:hypothetical protein